MADLHSTQERAQIFVTRELPGPALERLRAHHEVVVHPGSLPPTRAELEAGIARARGLLCLTTELVDAALLRRAPSLRAIANYAVGTDNINLETAAARGVAVGVTPDVLTDATADLTFALILGAARQLSDAARAVREGRWRTFDPHGWLGLELRGATLVIIGRGRIGRAVGHRATAFGMIVDFVGRGDDLHGALGRADIVSLHCPLTPQTRHLIDVHAIAAMRTGAILINTSRGGVVNQKALADALIAGTLGAAALDVTDPEPILPDDPLLAAPNLLVLPHIGSATRTARERMAELAVDNLIASLAGNPMPHPA